MDILVIQTGGTIDKDYPPQGLSYDFVINQPAAERIFTKVNPSFGHRTIELLKKDSSDLTHEDRLLIRQTCEKSEEKYIIITHGTDTITDTAQAIDIIEDKIIVLTGSMRPQRFGNTDADFNLGTAIGALSALQPGVYIAMSGRVLPWRRLHKDYDHSQFIES